MSNKGLLFIISAPSGAGKTTLVRYVLSQRGDLAYSISHTTRAPRENEKNGEDYFFITPAAFEKKIENNQLLEWAKVHDNYYGTSREFVEQTLETGRSLILDIDVQGALQIMESNLDPVSIFIMPPSVDELENRLRKRGTDSEDVIATRLHNAKLEIEHCMDYRYIVVNDRLEKAKRDLLDVFAAELDGRA